MDQPVEIVFEKKRACGRTWYYPVEREDLLLINVLCSSPSEKPRKCLSYEEIEALSQLGASVKII